MNQLDILQEIITFVIVFGIGFLCYIGSKKNISIKSIFLGYYFSGLLIYYLNGLAREEIEMNATDKAVFYSLLWAAGAALIVFLYNRYYPKK